MLQSSRDIYFWPNFELGILILLCNLLQKFAHASYCALKKRHSSTVCRVTGENLFKVKSLSSDLP